MIFETHCKTGKLQVDETMIQVVAPFKKVVWSAPRNSVTQITHKPAPTYGTLDLTVYTTLGVYEVAYFPKKRLATLMELFPGVQAQASGSVAWWLDTAKLTYVGTYADQGQMQREIESAALTGWIVQSTAGISGHVKRGLFMPKVTQDKVTVTFVRSPEWITQNR